MSDTIIEYQCYIVYSTKTHEIHRIFKDQFDAAYCMQDMGEGYVVLNPKILENEYEGLSHEKKMHLHGAVHYMHTHVKFNKDGESFRIE